MKENSKHSEKKIPAITFKMIDVKLIDPAQHSGHDEIDHDALLELATSIDKNGLIQPIVLKQRKNRYEIVAGHRRFYAHKLLNKTKIMSAIVNISDEQVYLNRLSKNIDRENVSIYEEAQLIETTKRTFRLNNVELAKKLGKSNAFISQRLAIMKYKPALQQALKKKLITFSVARALNKIEDTSLLDVYLQSAIDNNITPQMAEHWAEQANITTEQMENGEQTEPDFSALEEPPVHGTTCFFSDKFYPFSAMRNIWVSKEWLGYAIDALIKRQAASVHPTEVENPDPDEAV